MAAPVAVVASDLVIAFMWVWSGAIIKLVVYRALAMGLLRPDVGGEVLKGTLSVAAMFFFAWLGKVTRGGAYNPLTVLSYAMHGSFGSFLLTLFARIPAQVIGSVIGVGLIKETFPEVGHGPRLNVDLHRGALTEGLLTFMIVMVSQGLKKKDPKGFFMNTWVSSISKLSLHIMGSDLTGGCMNPASAFGWAYARGDHITREHLYVYWLAPFEATMLAAWIFRLLVQPQKHKERLHMGKKSDKKTKSE